MSPAAVPFLDLLPSSRLVEEGFFDELRRLYAKGAFSGGPYVESFEKAFSAYLGAARCVGVNSGCSAVHLALLALGVGPGDEVVVPAFTFVGTAWGVLYCGARPVFVDVEADSACIDPAAVERAITKRTKAVIAVHLYGRPADLAALKAVCRARKVALIEDAAQAHGAFVDMGGRLGRRRVGTVGDLGCFSFYPSKNLGAAGEGGAVTTSSARLAERVERLRNHGQKVRYRHETLGFNYRMDGIQGLFLERKLAHLDAMNARRKEIAGLYLARLRGPAAASLPASPESVWHLFVVRAKNRRRLQAGLDAAGIGHAVHYPLILPELPPFRPFVKDPERFEVSRSLSRSVVSLPMFYGMDDAQVERVADVVNTMR